MSFASIDESIKTITNNLSSNNLSNESAKVDNSKLTKFSDAVDMEKYNEKVINEQIKKSNLNRKQIEEDAMRRVADYNSKVEELKSRALKYEQEQKKGWDEFKNHWFWKHYFLNTNNTSYSEKDNINDSLNENNYIPVEISKDFQPVGDSADFDYIAPYVENHHYYLKNDGSKYIYNYPHNLMFPVEQNIDKNSPEVIKQDLKVSANAQTDDIQTLDLALKLKEKLSQQKNQNMQNMQNKETEKENTQKESKEHFESLDPKLVQIYQKTLPPGETHPPPKVENKNMLFNYLYCLIFIVFVYIVFRNA